MADTPKNDRAGARAISRATTRAESVAALLAAPLEDEAKILDALVTALAAAEPTEELFARLHEAALTQERSANLSFAYERIARDNRLKLLSKRRQAEFLLHASTFFAEVLGDVEAAIGYAERARHLAPDDPTAFDRLETMLASAQQGVKLAKLYAEQAASVPGPDDKLRFLRAAADLYDAYGGSADDNAKLYREILRLSPSDTAARATLERLYGASRRFKDLAELLEQSVLASASVDDEDAIRLQLIAIYRGELRDPARAAPHVEALLARDPIGLAALQAAEALADHRPVAARIAPLLSDAYRRLGRHEDEASTLALELKLARPPRLAEVHRRLAILRQDVLGDPAGALELLEPLVARDPTDDDLRARYLEVSRRFHRELEAAKLLSRASTQVKDAAARARVGLEIAGLYAAEGDARRARAALSPLLDDTSDETVQLLAAKRILEYSDDATEPRLFARALEVLIHREEDFPTRVAAAKRLAELADGPLADTRLAIVAWRALVSSPRGDDALGRLEVLYSETADDAGTIDVLSLRAARAKTTAQAREFAFRATELRAARADRAGAIAAYRAFLRDYGPTRDVHALLAPLYEAERNFSELAWVIEQDLSLTPENERAPSLAKLGRILITELGDVPRALDALDAALAVDPREATARKLLDRLLAEGEHRIDAAGILEPIYRAEGNHAGVVRLLAARAEVLTDPARRLAALDEGFRLAEAQLADPRRALELSGRALQQSARFRRGDVSVWLGRFRDAAERAADPARRGELLTLAIADVSIDDESLVELARDAAEALVGTGEVGRAIDVYRRLLSLEPGSPDLIFRIDELLAEQGNPGERIALYRAALEQHVTKSRRLELLHSIARIQRDLGDARASAETLERLVAENPTDIGGHDALVEAYASLGETARLAAELERALDWTEGERRASTAERLARELAKSGDAPRALALYLELVDRNELGPAGLSELVELAEAQPNVETLVRVLELSIARSEDVGERARSFEKLGDVRAGHLADTAGALEAWRQGARSCTGPEGEPERARRLYERILDARPEDREAARYLVEAYAAEGAWSKVPAVFSILLRPEPSNEAIDLALSLEASAIASGEIDAFVAMIDEAEGRQTHETSRRARELLASKARALGKSSTRRGEAPSIFRGLVESFGNPRDVAEFAKFLEETTADGDKVADQRWLFAWRATHDAGRVEALEAWAIAEETRFGNVDAAIGLYAELLEADPGHRGAREALCRLELDQGDAERLLRALGSARDRAPEGAALDVDLRIASLLVERLERTDEALPILSALLERTPDHPGALAVAREALRRGRHVSRAAEVFGGAAAAADGRDAEPLLRMLVEATQGDAALGDARAEWYLRLVELEPDDAAGATLALVAAEDIGRDPRLWEVAERLARRTADPAPLAAAYRRALFGPVSAEVGEAIGHRFVEFHEEWFDDADAVLVLLERVLELAPRARWALERIKLHYNAEGRWEQLFALYDRAIASALDDAERIELYDEAALAAKDLANDSQRAIRYLELLQGLRPEARFEAMLERLYERTGKLRELLALLEKRAMTSAGAELVKLRLRLAKIQLELAEPISAFELLEQVRKGAPEERDVYVLLESLVAATAGQFRSKSGKARRKRPRNVRAEAIVVLRARYEATKDALGSSRAIEAALDDAETRDDKARLTGELVHLYVETLGDRTRGFDHLASLVRLEPKDANHRARLAELAGQMGAEGRRAELLVEVASDSDDVDLQIELFREAASLLESIGEVEGAAVLYGRAFELAESDGPSSLAIAAVLEPLLVRLDRPAERCHVLERVAYAERDPAKRRETLGALAFIAFETLCDADRAVRAWRMRLADDPGDVAALDGLAAVFERTARHRELADVLTARAPLVPLEASRADRVRVARLYARELAEPTRAVEAWRAIATEFGPDGETFEALSTLLEGESRFVELAELVEAEADRTTDPDRAGALRRTLGDLHRDRTKDADRALQAYVASGDFRSATTSAENVADRAVKARVASALFEFAAAAFEGAAGEARIDVDNAARTAIDDLVRYYLEEGDAARAVDIELRGAALPFDDTFRRKLRRDAAFTVCDRLEDAGRAIAILKELFAENGSDEVASASIARFARLLDESGRNADLVDLWERQAMLRADAGDAEGAAALFTRAGEIAETRLGDLPRAIHLFRGGAAFDGQASLEALARLYSERRDWADAAAALEWLCARSSRETLAVRALRLAEAYLAVGEWERARDRLEFATVHAANAGSARTRLAKLYREHLEWAALSRLLVDEAGRAPDLRTTLALLKEAASLHSVERGSPADAIPLLERAVELDPDDPELRLSLSAAFSGAGRLDEAADALRAQIARYGPRRPKERATIHLQLARVALAAGLRAEALSELDFGAKINPAHPDLLHELGRLSLEEGQLERAERTYRALLLIVRRPGVPYDEAHARSGIYLDLSEIAARQGESERAAELVESAFESALDDPRETLPFERALERKGRRDLLSRAVESRLATATDPATAARALSDLVMLHEAPSDAGSPLRKRVRDEAGRVQLELESITESGAAAWEALTHVYEWLEDPELEARALERRVDALLRDGDTADVEPIFRLAEARLANVARRQEGVSLVERALELGGDPERAWDLLRSVSATASDDPFILKLLERIAHTSGKERALLEVTALRAALGPVDIEAVRRANEIALRLGEDDVRVSLLRGALAHSAATYLPHDKAEIETGLARLLFARGAAVASGDLLLDALAVDDSDGARALALDVAGLLLGDPAELELAARLYRAILDRDPSERKAWEPLLELYRRSGDDARLLTLVKTTAALVDSPPDRSRLRLEEATLMLADASQTEAAITLLKEVVSDDPANDGAADLLFLLLDRQDRIDELLAIVTAELDDAKASADALGVEAAALKLGGLLERKGNGERALEVYSSILGWNPSSRQALRALVRLEDTTSGSADVADAIERLLPVEEPSLVGPLARRLVDLRSKQGDALGVERALRVACAVDPSDSALREQLLAKCLHRGDWLEAAAVLSRAAEADTSDPTLLVRAMEAYERGGDLESAIAALGTALERTGGEPDYYVERARLLVEVGKNDAALADMEAAHAADGSRIVELTFALEGAIERTDGERRAEHTLRLVDLLEEVGETTRAREQLGRLVKLQPKHRDAMRRFATLAAVEARWDEAAATYRRLIPLEEKEFLVAAAMNLADACEQSGHLADARGGLERALEAVPTDTALSERLRQLYEATGARRELAQLVLREARSATDVAARVTGLLRGAELLLGRDGDPNEALEVLEEARRLSPENTERAVLLARAETVLGRVDRAKEALRAVITAHRGRRSRDLSLVYRELSTIELEEGDLSAALESLSKAFDLDSKNGELAMQLGYLALDVDDPAAAAKAFRSVTMMRPKVAGSNEGASAEAKAVAYYHLARIAETQGDVRRARLMASKAVSENPNHAEAQALLQELTRAG